ncbi:MAG TPA: BsuPI-related putative proteinase inhibitor [Bryobacteraceae bacterium]|nr:BsuPI-related putative proteinase inhibitor [Bryobacteraceae bacterium]
MRTLTLLLSLCAAMPAADFLPLEPGNSWTYRQAGGNETFTISVGTTPAVIGGEVYYRLTGYVKEPVWARVIDDALYYRDEERERDVLLTLFALVDGAWFEAPLRTCEQEGQPFRNKERYEGPAGHHGSTLVVRYRTFSCADAGVVSEEFLENIGMVRREVTTIAGPRVYELVDARVGGLSLAAKPSTAFRVSLQSIEEKKIAATLKLIVSGAPVTLKFNSSQEFDAVLKDPKGDTIYVWSSDKAFLQALHERTIEGEATWRFEIPLAKALDQPGRYTLEGWITSGQSNRDYSAVTAFEVIQPAAVPASAARISPRPMRGFVR